MVILSGVSIVLQDGKDVHTVVQEDPIARDVIKLIC